MSNTHRRKTGEKKLGRAALEDLVVAVHGECLRTNRLRKKVGERCANSPEEVEAALLSDAVQKRIQGIARACTAERMTPLLQKLFDGACDGQPWAWKILLESTGLADRIRATVFLVESEESEAFVSTAFERRLIEELRELAGPAQKTAPGGNSNTPG